MTFGRDPGPGRSGPSTAPHLALSPSPALHAMAGRLNVDATGCTLDNTGRWLRLRVLHLDGVERSDLDPGRGLRIPWARSRVEVAVGAEPLWFELEVPQRAGAPGGVPDAGGDTQRGLGLDRSAGYFRALVALCEPRLRDPGCDAVASAGEIARRLTSSGQERGRVSQKAVERRLANARQRLGIGAADPFGGSAAGLELRDAARVLVDLVLRTGTVTRADLALLDPRVRSG
ncbi:MAG TPA: hypothetical protein VNA11_03545 [Pseudonocardia sp.]|nr:hypothetical protein [Pseudonocardia sp.]